MGAVIGIFAHVDAGKTTLSEQILYKTGAVRKMGRVDSGDTLMDSSQTERERGITVFTDEAPFFINDEKFYLLDTPGHMDFAGEMERAQWALNCAVVVVSTCDSIPDYTLRILSMLKEKEVPTFLFLGKADRDISDGDKTLSMLKNESGLKLVAFPHDFFSHPLSEEFKEACCDVSDSIANLYLEDKLTDDILYEHLKSEFLQCSFCPAITGSALLGTGVDGLLFLLSQFFPKKAYEEEPFSAVLYKVRHGKDKERICHLKILSGSVCPKAEVAFLNSEGVEEKAKINEIREYKGSKFSPLAIASRGQLCAVTGISSLAAGSYLGSQKNRHESFKFFPLMSAQVIFPQSCSKKDILESLKIIEDEEQLIKVFSNSQTGEIEISYMGDFQLEILKRVFSERFSIPISFGERSVAYKETILSPVIGSGHYEPLKHYAEVHLLLSPNKAGEGITFESSCHTDFLAQSWQNLIKTHVFETEYPGVLTGSPIEDIKITLLGGKSHEKHTEGGDFREAVSRAIMQGLMKSESIILEPWYSFKTFVAANLAGRIFSDVEKMGGSVTFSGQEGNNSIIKGICPTLTMQNYQRELSSFSGGTGRLSLDFYSYLPVKNQSSIIEKKRYDPLRNLSFSPDSVFCPHGTGHSFKWDECDEKMHIDIKKFKI